MECINAYIQYGDCAANKLHSMMHVYVMVYFVVFLRNMFYPNQTYESSATNKPSSESMYYQTFCTLLYVLNSTQTKIDGAGGRWTRKKALITTWAMVLPQSMWMICPPPIKSHLKINK